MVPVIASDWEQFQKDEMNVGWTIDDAPISGPVLMWSYNTDGGGMSGIDTTPIVADGKVFVLTYQGYLYIFDAFSGQYINRTLCNDETTGGFELSTPAYHDGIVYVATSKGNESQGHGRVTAIYAEDGGGHLAGDIREQGDLGEGLEGFQLNTPVTYADGKIYVGNWKGGTTHTEDNGTYYCLDASDVTSEVWNRTASYATGYYWAGAAIIDNYVIYGDDRANVTCLNKDTGAFVDYINVSEEYGIDAREIRSSIVWNDGYDRIYFTSKGGYAFAIGFDAETGYFNTTGNSDWNSPHDIGYTTSTPVVYDSRVCVSWGGFGANGKIYCLDESDGSEIWSTSNIGGIQGSPAVSVVDGHKYIYFTVNNANGSVYCLEDMGGIYEQRWEWNPPAPDNQYIMQGMIISDGMVYFGTDYGTVYALKERGICGDVNLDDVINPLDAMKVYNGDISSGEWAADVNCDGVVNPLDAMKIYNGDLNCCSG